ncbi:MAG: rod-binding protein [Planctomycetales bacterium]|nr:rod-binding protein [Planctomycetales bacterium]
MKINPAQLGHVKPLRPGPPTEAERVESAGELRDVFREFVGKTFFGQMLKSMRSTVGEAAYFNGGHAEKVWQGQLDAQLSEQMTEASASKFADPMFRQQFPQQAALLQAAEAKPATLGDLSALRRL